MYESFRKWRGLKILGLFFGIILAYILLAPACALVNGQKVPLESLIGRFANQYDAITIENDTKGIMETADGEVYEFVYHYSQGNLSCESGDLSWDVRVLSEDRIYNHYNDVYLIRSETYEESYL